MFFVVEPEVAGGFGERTIFIDRKARPPKLERFHYEMQDWMGDSLLETVCCFIVTTDAAKLLQTEGLTGFTLDSVEVTVSDEFEEREPNAHIPEFVWLKVSGRPGVDDFALNEACRLNLSERAVTLLKQRARLQHASCDPV